MLSALSLITSEQPAKGRGRRHEGGRKEELGFLVGHDVAVEGLGSKKAVSDAESV